MNTKEHQLKLFGSNFMGVPKFTRHKTPKPNKPKPKAQPATTPLYNFEFYEGMKLYNGTVALTPANPKVLFSILQKLAMIVAGSLLIIFSRSRLDLGQNDAKLLEKYFPNNYFQIVWYYMNRFQTIFLLCLLIWLSVWFSALTIILTYYLLSLAPLSKIHRLKFLTVRLSKFFNLCHLLVTKQGPGKIFEGKTNKVLVFEGSFKNNQKSGFGA